MLRPNAIDWLPPEAYPAILETLDDGRDVLTFPNFEMALVLSGGEEPLQAGREAVGRWLRARVANRQLMPFAANPEVLTGTVLMISTAGWNNPVVDAEEQDG